MDGESNVVYIQDRNAVVRKGLNLLVPARGLEVAVAPRVVVKGKEIGSLIVAAAVHVLCCLQAVGRHVSSRVSNRNLAQSLRVHVVLHVTSDGLDVGGTGIGSRLVVDDLVAGEESQCVVILGKHLHGSKNALEILGVVGRSGLGAVDGVAGVVDIKNQVDASVGESVHAVIVVLGVVDSIDADNIDAKVLEVLDVSLTRLGIGQGVRGARRTTRLVVDTAKIEALAISPESYTSKIY